MLLRRGNVGNPVVTMQYALNGVKPSAPKLKCDGIFGPRTEERVRQHQSQCKLLPDGIVGPLTLDSLFEIMTMRGHASFVRSETADSVTTSSPEVRILPRDWLNPDLSAYMRHQEAFWTWWVSQPKAPLPTYNPAPGFWGPLHYPLPHIPVMVQGPPATRTHAQVPVPVEGAAFRVSVQGGVPFDVMKGFKEAEYRFSIDWAAVKGRFADMKVGVSGSQAYGHGIKATVETTVEGSKLSLKHKLGEIGALKLVPYLGTAVTSEIAFIASGGVKAYAEIDITKVGPVAIKASAGIKGGPKLSFGPVKQPDGQESQQWMATPFGGTGFVTFSGSW